MKKAIVMLMLATLGAAPLASGQQGKFAEEKKKPTRAEVRKEREERRAERRQERDERRAERKKKQEARMQQKAEKGVMAK
jgi:Ni/Co efflux regulator RcnB